MQIDPVVLFYVLPFALISAYYAIARRRSERLAVAARENAIEAGLSEPQSLHPLIDSTLCIGCKACLSACPEGNILGLINNKAQLIEPSNCIGHGACKTACPRGAISLVFGTSTRGVDLPVVGSDFETGMPGIFIAGELGGMGLIRNAIEQGRQALDSIATKNRNRRDGMHEVVIVGAGPAGLSASLRALELGVDFVTLEQDTFGGTVAHFPRGKVVMTSPAHLPLVGNVRFKEISKEKLLAFWQQVLADTGLRVRCRERVLSITPISGGYMVKSSRAQYATRNVLLAIGRRGTPRKLGVQGEEMSKVVYRLTDPEQFRKQHVLVVGGGDSALEAAASIAAEPGSRVTLSYRGEAFGRAKQKNRSHVDEAASAGRLEIILNSQVFRILPGAVELSARGALLKRKNDAVIVCVGGVLPTDFLRSIGIGIETKYGTA